MYSLLHCLLFYFFLRQASDAHVTPGETRFRGTVRGGLQSNATKAGLCHRLVAGVPTLWMPLGDRHPEALQFWVREGRARPAEVGPFVRIYFLVRGGGQKMDLRLHIVVFFNSFISNGKKRKMDLREEKKKQHLH